jgi:preprotein translocase subunit SecE
MTKQQLTRALAIFALFITALVVFVWWFDDGCVK